MSASTASTLFEAHRVRLIGLGYRMLGSRSEAEDLVQDTYLRWHRAATAVDEPAAWLTTTMTRLCLDALRARKVRAADYVGPWLPEPYLTDAPGEADGERARELADDLSVAFMLLLERLAPEERAAFLLHDVFDARYPDIAAALGKTETAVRQIVARARTRVAAERPRFRATRREQNELAARFQQALLARDDAALLALFKPEATLVSDGGGKAIAALRPIYGAEKIVRFFMGISRQQDLGAFARESCWLNGAPGIVLRVPGGDIFATLAIEVDDGRIANLYLVRNPDKLENLLPAAGGADA
jgi:RNA polymerase sigma-70 factor (ECF subfamily)